MILDFTKPLKKSFVFEDRTRTLPDTSDTDDVPVDTLCTLLSSFHISLRLARIADYEEHEGDFESAWNSLLFLSTRLIGPGRLPDSVPGRPPCWQAPYILPWQLLQLEQLMEVQRELARQDGNKEIAWRTEVMDNLVEKELLSEYEDWVYEETVDAEKVSGNQEEVRFWKELQKNIAHDFNETLEGDRSEILERHGKRLGEWFAYKKRVIEVGREKYKDFRIIFA